VKEPLASRLLFPFIERRFTYAEYARFLGGLGDRDVVPMRELARGAGDLALRHDVDSRLESALELARHDPDLEQTVDEISRTISKAPAPAAPDVDADRAMQSRDIVVAEIEFAQPFASLLVVRARPDRG